MFSNYAGAVSAEICHAETIVYGSGRPALHVTAAYGGQINWFEMGIVAP